MLTVKAIQSEIDDLLVKGTALRVAMEKNVNGEDKKDYDKAKKRVAFLKLCLFYLQENPREEFISEQLKKIREKQFKIMDGFQDWLEYQPKDLSKSGSDWRA